MIDLEKLMKLHDAATPGPWKVKIGDFESEDGYGTVTAPYVEADGKTICVPFDRGPDDENDEADAAYIVAACNAVPELVARIRALESQRDWLAGIASHYTDRTNCYNPFAYNGVDNACLKDCRDRDCKKCWLVAAKEYTQFSALEQCRIVSIDV